MGNKTRPIKDPRDLDRLKNWLKENDYPIYVYSQIALATGYRAGDLVKLTVAQTKKALKEEGFTIIEIKKENIKRTNVKKKIDENNKDETKEKREFCEKRFTKTLIPRKAKIKNNLKHILQEYIKDKKDWEYLFTAPKDPRKHISVKQTCRVINKATKELNIPVAICNHGLRKTYGYIIYKKALEEKKEASYGLLLVQKMYCHASLNATKVYIGLDEEEEDMVLDEIDSLLG